MLHRHWWKVSNTLKHLNSLLIHLLGTVVLLGAILSLHLFKCVCFWTVGVIRTCKLHLERPGFLYEDDMQIIA